MWDSGCRRAGDGWRRRRCGRPGTSPSGRSSSGEDPLPRRRRRGARWARRAAPIGTVEIEGPGEQQPPAAGPPSTAAAPPVRHRGQAVGQCRRADHRRRPDPGTGAGRRSASVALPRTTSRLSRTGGSRRGARPRRRRLRLVGGFQRWPSAAWSCLEPLGPVTARRVTRLQFEAAPPTAARGPSGVGVGEVGSAGGRRCVARVSRAAAAGKRRGSPRRPTAAAASGWRAVVGATESAVHDITGDERRPERADAEGQRGHQPPTRAAGAAARSAAAPPRVPCVGWSIGDDVVEAPADAQLRARARGPAWPRISRRE